MSQSPYVIVLTTLPAQTDVADFAGALIEDRLAACVSAYPEMQSYYRWEDQLEVDAERQIIIKTTGDRVAALWERIRGMHPYEVPEFLVLAVSDGSQAYLDWVSKSTR
jgi:periplasmic divalent cation tolerance protein